MAQKFETTVLDMIEQASRTSKTTPLNLGGMAGAGGGVGGPPGGFIGWLPQTRVAYDYDEVASSGIPASGVSILDNLNHIRYRIEVLESGWVLSSGIIVTDENTSSIYNNTTDLHFVGSGVSVTDLGGGEVRVTINATGSGGGISDAPSDGDVYGRKDGAWVTITASGISTFVELTDTPSSYTGQAGKVVVVNGTETALEFTTVSGVSSSLTVQQYGGSPSVSGVDTIIFSGAAVTSLGSGDVLVVFSGGTSIEQILHYYNDDLTSQIPITTSGGIYTTTKIYESGTLRVYYNGLRQRKDYHYVEMSGFVTFSTYFPTYSGDVMVVDYDYYLSAQTDGYPVGSLTDGTDYLVDSDGIIITESL